MENIIIKIRGLIEDFSTLVTDVFTYGSSTTFTLSESNIISIVDVYLNDVSSGILHTYNSTTKKVTVNTSMTTGDSVKIEYNAYLNYSDTELKEYIKSALIYLTIHNYYDFEYDSVSDDIYPDLEVREESLIAAISAVLINKPVSNYRLPNLNISIPETDSVDKKIGKIVSAFKRSREGHFDII